MSATVTSASSTTQQPSPAEHVMQLATGYVASISIYIVAKLGIADLLNDGPRTTAELAAATHTIEDRLYRVLRVLASVGVFREAGPRRFSLTPAAESLRSDVPRVDSRHGHLDLRPYASPYIRRDDALNKNRRDHLRSSVREAHL